MKLLTLFLLTVPCLAQLPNPKLTPGAIRTTNAVEICADTFRAGPYRHTTAAMKKQVCRSYGVAHCPQLDVMEIDHLIPLELGGADEITNLWPEMAEYRSHGVHFAPGFHVKDQLENELHRRVCRGKMGLPEAQACIAKNWVQCYDRIIR